MKKLTLTLLLFLPSCKSSHDYCKFTSEHTLCKYKPGKPSSECGKVKERGMADEDEKNEILRIHNELRARIATGNEERGNPGPQLPASNMMEMTWDDELELLAQTWTDQCITDHDCPDCRTVDRFKTGQNLYMYGYLGGTWEKSITGWYDEVVDFNHNYRYPFNVDKGVLVGHFTQLIWAQTSKIGCGKIYFYPSSSSSNRWGKQLFICNYGVAGNLIGSELYKTGEPCTQCPDGTECSINYPGLCSGNPNQVILTIRPPTNFPFPSSKPDETILLNSTTTSTSPPPIPPQPTEDNKENRCNYKCKQNGGCTVGIEFTRFVNGPTLGSCFSESFGGTCSGTPYDCQDCKNICVHYPPLTKISISTINKDDVVVSSLDGGTSPSKGISECVYKCQTDGSCEVKLESNKHINGNTLGSCFSKNFGGKCSGTPRGCQECLVPCQNRKGDTFAVKVTP